MTSILIDQFTIPRFAVMWAIAFGMYGTLKMLSLRGVAMPATAKWVYLLGWPGMNPRQFLEPATVPPVRVWLFAAIKMFFGFGLIAIALDSGLPILPAGLIGMTGIVFVLHFGLFHLLACLWQSFGWKAKPIMNAPILACSLADFWGQRWNLAFRDLTHRFLFKPLTPKLGPTKAMLVGFLASGLIHELAITVPAGVGYGGPTLFFLVQAGGLMIERAFHRLKSRWLTAACLLAPLPLLIPPAFISEIIMPFLQFLRRS